MDEIPFILSFTKIINTRKLIAHVFLLVTRAYQILEVVKPSIYFANISLLTSIPMSNFRFIMPRPEGQRCLVISANGVTVSRQRNGRILHSFPSALPNGARTKEVAAGSHVYCILDCIFHEVQLNPYSKQLFC